jgi:hypothetical protein
VTGCHEQKSSGIIRRGTFLDKPSRYSCIECLEKILPSSTEKKIFIHNGILSNKNTNYELLGWRVTFAPHLSYLFTSVPKMFDGSEKGIATGMNNG